MTRTTTLILGALASACGAAEVLPPPELTIARTVPTSATATARLALELDDPIDALGVDADGALVVAAGGRIFTLDGDTLERHTLYQEGDDPAALGRVHHVSPRAAGGAWIAADAGLFVLDGLYVTSARLDVGGVSTVHEVVEGPLTGLWLTSDEGLVRRTTDTLVAYDVPSLDDAPTAIAVEGSGDAALALGGGAVALIEPDGERMFADRPPLDAGRVHAVAASRGALWAAADGGLVRYDATRAPAWTRFTLKSSDAERVAAVAVTSSDEVWARTIDALVRVHGDSLTRFDVAALEAVDEAHVAIDARGDVFTARGRTLVGLAPGVVEVAVSFERDVRPWIVERCAACHSNQTQDFQDHRVFSALAEDALARVRSGDMPRCAGGLPCAPEARLAPADYAVVEAWVAAGRPE